MLTRVARSDVILDKGIDTWEPIVSSDQFDSPGDVAMSSERSVMMFLQDIHAQLRVWNVDEALVEEQPVTTTRPQRRRRRRKMLLRNSVYGIQ